MLGDAGIVEGLVHAFEKKAMLRVHREGLALGDVEEGRIEHGDILAQEATASRVVASQLVGVRMIIPGLAEPVLGHLGPAASGAAAELVELLRVRDAPGQSAGHADDGNWSELAAGIGINRLSLDVRQPVEPIVVDAVESMVSSIRTIGAVGSIGMSSGHGVDGGG